MGSERYPAWSRTGRHRTHDSGHSSRAKRRDPAKIILWITLFLVSSLIVGTEWNIAFLKYKFIKMLPWILPALALIVARSWKSGLTYAAIILVLSCANIYFTAFRIEHLSNQVLGIPQNWLQLLVPKPSQLQAVQLAIVWISMPAMGLGVIVRALIHAFK